MKEYEFWCEECRMVFPVFGIMEDGIFTHRETDDEATPCPNDATHDVSKIGA